MSEISIASLHVYPIKSAAPIDVASAHVLETGLEFDRQFMLVDSEGNFISQRTREIGPKLTRVKPHIVHNVGLLAVHVERFGDTAVPLELALTDDKPLEEQYGLVEATLHGKPVVGAEVSSEASGFFSDFLDRPVRLLRIMKDHHPRYISERRHYEGASNQVGFADGYSMLLTSQKSLERLNEEPQLKRAYHGNLTMERFRPNIVIDGDESLEAYDEDFWRYVQIGEMGARVAKACARCVIPDINQQTGRTGFAVRRALAATRKGRNDVGGGKGVFFGQNLNHLVRPGLQLAVGDPVQVQERADAPNVILAR